MKTKELHELTVDELNTKLKELSEELFNLRFRHAIGQLENSASLKTCKKDIAKVKTRLVRIPNGTQSISTDAVNSFISKGLRLWDQTFTPSGSGSNGVYNSTVSQLKKASNGAVFTFSDGNAVTGVLSRILRYFSSNKVTATYLTVLDTPVNKLSEKR